MSYRVIDEEYVPYITSAMRYKIRSIASAIVNGEILLESNALDEERRETIRDSIIRLSRLKIENEAVLDRIEHIPTVIS